MASLKGKTLDRQEEANDDAPMDIDDVSEPTNRIALPAIKRVWKVVITDDIDKPKQSTAFLIRGAQSVMDAAGTARKSPAFKAFQNVFPTADVVVVEFIGTIAN